MIEKPGISRNVIVILLLATILLIAACTYFSGLGRLTLYPWDEARFSEVTSELTKKHNWLDLTFNQRPYLRKPPLYFWLNSITFKALGEGEFASRFTTAFLGVLTVGLVFIMGIKMFDLTTATLSSLVLLATPLFFTEARIGMVDVTLTFFTTLSLFFFYLSLSREKHILLFFLFSGLAVMTKSAAGIIPLGVAAIYLLLTRDFRCLKNRYFYLGIIVFAIIVLPWHWYQVINHPTFFGDSYFSREIVDRMAKPLDSHSGNYFYYLSAFLSRAFPWSVIFFMGIIVIFVEKNLKTSSSYLLSWFFTIIITFSLMSTKNPPYVLPMLPPMALFVGYFCQWHLRNRTTLADRFFLGFNLLLTIMWLVIVLGFFVYYLDIDLGIIPRKDLQANLRMGGIIGSGLTFSLAAFYFAATKGKRHFLLVYFVGLAMCVIMANLEGANQAVRRDPFKNVKAVAEFSQDIVPEKKIIHSYKITCETISFYSQHRVVEYEKTKQIRQVTEAGDYYFILPSEDYHKKPGLFPDSRVEFEEGDILLISDKHRKSSS